MFYELRSLNFGEPTSLVGGVYRSLSHYVSALTREMFDEMLAKGKFSLILDGFDEINYDRREKYTEELNELSANNAKLQIILTTRPEEGMQSIQQFSVYRASRMTKEQTVQLLTLIDYDDEKKSAFIDRVASELYDKHVEFLSIPLLASIMLLTFSQHSDIPDKIHIFYQQAFEVLFQRHDRSKGAYTRKAYTDLAIDEFQRVFAYFCANSYVAQGFSFGETEVAELVNKSVEYEEAQCQPKLYLRDLLESTCLLQRDGPEYSFVHRSFQEYFTAYFISRLDETRFRHGIESVLRRANIDRVIEMTAAINRDMFERAWALKAVRSCVATLSNLSTMSTGASIAAFFSQTGIHESGLSMILDEKKPLGFTLVALDRVYGVCRFKTEESSPSLKEFISEIAEKKTEPLYSQLTKHFKMPIKDFLEGKRVPENMEVEEFDNFDELLYTGSGMRKWWMALSERLIALEGEIVTRTAARNASLEGVFAKKKFLGGS